MVEKGARSRSGQAWRWIGLLFVGAAQGPVCPGTELRAPSLLRVWRYCGADALKRGIYG